MTRPFVRWTCTSTLLCWASLFAAGSVLAQDSSSSSYHARGQTLTGRGSLDMQGPSGTRVVGAALISGGAGRAETPSGNTVVASGPLPALVGAALDSDRDLRPDTSDNCQAIPNPGQGDKDGDGFGDACDCDFNQDGTCGIADFNVFLADFQLQLDQGTGTDMNGDGTVGIQDFNLFLPGFQAGRPGPSAAGP